MSKLPFSFRVLKTFCPEHLYDEIEGDLIQKFNRDVNLHGIKKAQRKLSWNTLRFFRPGIMFRRKVNKDSNRVFMLSNYFKTSYRYISRRKGNAAIKLAGLTLALVSVMIIEIYVSYQLSFDESFTDSETVYRVNSVREESNAVAKYAVVPPAIGPALQSEFPEVKAFARVGIPGHALVKYNEKSFRPNGFVEADSSVFTVFSFQFIEGDKTALTKPGSVVLTKSLADQMFAQEDPMNKPLSFTEHNGKILYVTAIIEDLPANTHFNIRALTSSNSLSNEFETANDPWSLDVMTYLYIKLDKSESSIAFAERVNPFLQQHLQKREDGMQKSFAVSLQPLQSIYLDPALKMEFFKKGNPFYVYVFSMLGIFLLVIAGINYLNISIADFTGRLKELTLRKVLGGRKKQLMFQVGAEAAFYCIAAFSLSFAALYLLLPHVTQKLDPDLTLALIVNPRVLMFTGLSLLFLLLISLASPALFMTDGSANALKGFSIVRNRWGNSLMLVQFVISILCVTATIVVGRQVDFIKDSDVGYDRRNVVSLLMPDQYPIEKAPVLKSSLEALSGVESVSFSYYMISGAPYLKSWYQVETDKGMAQRMVNEVFIDHDFLPTMAITLLEGRNFQADNVADTRNAFIVNESAVKEFGWENAIGKKIKVGYGDEEKDWEGTVVGVTKDFNIRPLHEKIEPLIMRLQYDSWPGYWLNVRFSGSPKNTVASIKHVYEKILPGFVADSRFLDDIYSNQYKNEKRAYTALQFTTWIIVLVSALGVLSLSIYISARRVKEFSIRKVLGASEKRIIALQLSYFMKLVLAANLVALPFAWFIMNNWLDQFAYHTEITLDLFMGIFLSSAFLIVVTAGNSAWQAARKNPIDTIKAE
jgi:putative ABC transport system permease protein